MSRMPTEAQRRAGSWFTNRTIPEVPFETSADVPLVYGFGADRLVMAATMEKARRVLDRVATVVPKERIRRTGSPPGFDDIGIVFSSPKYAVRQYPGGHSRGPEYTVSLYPHRFNDVDGCHVGFTLRSHAFETAGASFVIGYRLAESYSESWRSTTPDPWYTSGELVIRSVQEGDWVRAEVEGPIQILEGMMARDFMLACQDPEIIRARAPEVKYFVPEHLKT